MKKLLPLALSLLVVSNVFAVNTVEQEAKVAEEAAVTYIMEQKAHYERLGHSPEQVVKEIAEDVKAVAQQGGLSYATSREKSAFVAGAAATLAVLAAGYGLYWAYGKWFGKKDDGKDDDKNNKDDKDKNKKKNGNAGGA